MTSPATDATYASEDVSEFNGTGGLTHSNVYLGGKLLATYGSLGVHFHASDGLGTHCVRVLSTLT